MKTNKTITFFLVLAAVIFFSSWDFSYEAAETYDILIVNARIIDGTGKAAFTGNIAIKGEKIAAVGKVTGDAATVIDADGLTVCPGFVDPHSHADLGIMEYPLAENFVMQGVTTFIGGNCGLSLAPTEKMSFSQWLSAVEEKGISINYAPLVGHNRIRELVMGDDFKREATEQEMESMKSYVKEAMQSGAFGFSTFTDPSAGEYAAFKEILELVNTIGKYGGVYFPHTRHIQSQWPSNDPDEYGYGIFHGPMEDVWVGMYRGVQEVIEISRRTGVPVHIAHFSNVYLTPQPHPEFLEEATARASLWNIDMAREEGVDVTFDIIMSASSISSEVPLFREFVRSRNIALDFLNDLSSEELSERLESEEFREKIREVYRRGRLKLGMIHTKADPYWFNCFTILHHKNIEYVGKAVGEISKQKNKDPLETLFDMLVEDPDVRWVQHLDRRQTEAATAAFLQHPLTMGCTDMGVYPADPKGASLPPPIAYGMYPDYIKKYVKERKVISLEEAIKKVTYLPARVINLDDRGIIRQGACADILIFDFEGLDYTGNFLNPAVRPEGINCVLINGQIVYKENTHTHALPGKVLRRNQVR
ncbi:MAG: amidohydrolase family protein [Candidatus Aminicenantes bacterium]|nr:amidohydrolase family protein [Candidatus Aminicenantes bacterium]